MQASLKRIPLPSAKTLAVAAVFGAAALAIVVAGLTIPMPGTGVVTDPREIFTTTGAGLTGPLGGIVIGILAGIREPGGIVLASLLAHVSGGLWMGFSYKKLVHEHTRMPLSILGWVAIVLVYYYTFPSRASLSGWSCSIPPSSLTGTEKGRSLIRACGDLGTGYAEPGAGVLPEALLTTR